jgi:uncharacterized protein (TIGR00297 family)
MIQSNYYPLIAFLFTGMVYSVWFKKLTVLAAIIGGICGFLVFTGAGYTGITIMATFFIIGTLATGWKMNEKQKLKAAEGDHGRRKASQVMANAGVAALAGMMVLIFPQYNVLWSLSIAASFSAATADTLASELGTIYGKRFYNILSWKPDKRGLDGVISLEGTLIGIGGSILTATIYASGVGWDRQFYIIIIAGTAGNIADSILGAGLERKGWLKNDAVNFLNTLIAAIVAAVMYLIS